MLEGKRIAILVDDGFEDSELFEPLRAMKEVDAKVIIIGGGVQDSHRGKRGRGTITVDAFASDVTDQNFDAVIIPGGHAPDRMRLNQSMIDLVKKVYDSGGVIAAICHGPQLLISADIVRGRRVTSWPSIAIDLNNAGAYWVDEAVVRDGNIITSRKPADLPKFNRSIVDALKR